MGTCKFQSLAMWNTLFALLSTLDNHSTWVTILIFSQRVNFYLLFFFRKMNSFQEMGFQIHHFPMDGRAKLDFMQLVSQEEASLGLLLMPLKLQKTLSRFGKLKPSRKTSLWVSHAIGNASSTKKKKKIKKWWLQQISWQYIYVVVIIKKWEQPSPRKDPRI